MRPEILFPLFRPVTALAGIGPKLARAVETLAGSKVVNLLWHLPGGLVDRRHSPPIAEAREGEIATLTIKVERHRKPPNPRLPYKVIASDASGRMALVFFHAREDYLQKLLPVGETPEQPIGFLHAPMAGAVKNHFQSVVHLGRRFRRCLGRKGA